MSDDAAGPGRVLPFPASRTTPPRRPGGFHELGIGTLALSLGVHDHPLTGHWCSRCQGLWYGLTLETECPACGNRRG